MYKKRWYSNQDWLKYPIKFKKVSLNWKTYRFTLMCVVDEMLHIKVLLNKMFHNATFNNTNINFACNTKSFIQIIK